MLEKKLLLIVTVALLGSDILAQKTHRLLSPNGKLEFIFNQGKDGSIHYSVKYQHKEIIHSSVLGLAGWDKNLSVRKISSSKNDATWKPVYGERSTIRNAYNGKFIALEKNNDETQSLALVVRAYDEGIAFKYLFPNSNHDGEITIAKELTEFVMPNETMAWYTDHAQGSYKLLPLSSWPGEAERPLTLQLKDGLFIALEEAQVVNYCRTKYSLSAAKPNTITCSMSDTVRLHTWFSTPWRVIMVAEKATQLLQNNDIILNLNEPCQIQNTSWIKPGKVMRETTLSTKGAKELVDFAVKRHLQYIHFDAGWYGFEYADSSDASRVSVDPKRNPTNDLDLQQVIQYAKSKDIGVFLYVNQRALAKQLDQILPLYEKWGVAGIKFGFVNVGSQYWTTWLHDAVKKCAQHHLMVDIHDEYRPTGFSRTYPNLLTQEGIRGNEEFPDANHNTILPFTRFLCGAGDYTICYYHRPELKPNLAQSMNARSLKTTSGHQLALSVVYYSPLQFLYWYDKPSDSQDEPELEFYDHVKTVWDDTKILEGEIGQYITVARRSGNEWFVGSITNNDARNIKINFSFLTPGQKYNATIYYDDPTSAVRTQVSIKRIGINSSSVLDFTLPASGGEALWIRPVGE